MAGIRWQIRRTQTYDILDGLWLTEMIFHTDDKRFGIMGDILLGWWPFINDPTMYLVDTNWIVGGRSGDYMPHTQIDFTFEGQLNIRPLHPDYPYVENGLLTYHNAWIAPTLSIKKTSQDYILAPDEAFNKGAPNSLDTFDLDDVGFAETQTFNRNSKTSDIQQPSGNGYLWIKGPDQNFNVTVTQGLLSDATNAIRNLSNGYGAWGSSGSNVIGFKAGAGFTNAARGMGYRSFIFDPFLWDRKFTVFMVVNDYMIAGLNFSTRIGLPQNWQQFSTSMNGNGQKAFAFHFDPKRIRSQNKNKPICIDWIFDIFYNPAMYPLGSPLQIGIAALAVFDGWHDVAKINPAYHALAQERRLARKYGFGNKKKVYNYGPTTKTILFDTPLMSDDYSIDIVSSLYTVNVLDRSRFGFSYQCLDPDANVEWTFTYSTKVLGDVSDII